MKKILGIDVGGTKIAAGLVSNSGSISNIKVVRTSQSNFTNQLLALINNYKEFDAIALAMPGQVFADGTVTFLPNIKGFQPANVKKLLQKKFRVPVSVINDAKAFALAEALIGQGKQHRTVAGIILGTGIGVGIVINKKIYFGKDGIAGEFDRVIMLDGKMIRDHRHKAGFFKKASGAKKFLTTLLNMVVLSFNPDVIILGGGWSNLSGMEKMANQLTKNLAGFQTKTPVKISKLKYAGIIGAVLVLNK